ncbi:MAG: ethanolamine utilization protein EutJ [Caldithrix sp.]|nr:ethanolamine utilization protein EutJ [Caldithrix sp.]
MDLINKRLRKVGNMVNQTDPIPVKGFFQVGIDLGTANIVLIVVDETGEPLAAFMEWAEVVRDGIVLDYWGATQIVKKLQSKAEQRIGRKIEQAITSFPPGTDPMISENVIKNVGLKVQHVIDEPSSVIKLLNIDSGMVVDIGGGTTGIAMIRDGSIRKAYDEPTGGRHVTLTLSGNQKISFDEAEKRKTGPDAAQYKPVVEPVFQKMADIIRQQIDGQTDLDIYLSGGACCFPGFDEVLRREIARHRVIKPFNPLYLTPLAIASYGGV